MTVATDAQLRDVLSPPAGWRRRGDQLVRELRFRSFPEAMACFERIAHGAVDFGRRPDLCLLGGSEVRVVVGNAHHAGVGETELRLIDKVDAIVAEHCPRAAAAQ